MLFRTSIVHDLAHHAEIRVPASSNREVRKTGIKHDNLSFLHVYFSGLTVHFDYLLFPLLRIQRSE